MPTATSSVGFSWIVGGVGRQGETMTYSADLFSSCLPLLVARIANQSERSFNQDIGFRDRDGRTKEEPLGFFQQLIHGHTLPWPHSWNNVEM